MLRFGKLFYKFLWPTVRSTWKHRNHPDKLYVWSGVIWVERLFDHITGQVAVQHSCDAVDEANRK